MYIRLALLFVISFWSLVVFASNPIGHNHIGLSRVTNYEDLKDKGFQPRKDLPPWPFHLPINWAVDPFKDNNWKFNLEHVRLTVRL